MSDTVVYQNINLFLQELYTYKIFKSNKQTM